jgi:hypothetical protein
MLTPLLFPVAHISSGSNSYNGGHFDLCTGGRRLMLFLADFDGDEMNIHFPRTWPS